MQRFPSLNDLGAPPAPHPGIHGEEAASFISSDAEWPTPSGGVPHRKAPDLVAVG